MSTIMENKPVQVSFRINQRPHMVAPLNKPSKIKIPDCDWKKVIEIGLYEHNPDMIISEVKLEGNMIKFVAKFNNRPNSSTADIKWRVYNFLNHTPTLKIRELKVRK